MNYREFFTKLPRKFRVKNFDSAMRRYVTFLNSIYVKNHFGAYDFKKEVINAITKPFLKTKILDFSCLFFSAR